MKKSTSFLLYIGYIAIFISALLYPSGHIFNGIQIAVITLGIGSLSLIAYRIANPLEGENVPRTKRLEFQLVISSILYLAATYFMYNRERHWVICLLIAAITDLVVAFRTPNKNK